MRIIFADSIPKILSLGNQEASIFALLCLYRFSLGILLRWGCYSDRLSTVFGGQRSGWTTASCFELCDQDSSLRPGRLYFPCSHSPFFQFQLRNGGLCNSCWKKDRRTKVRNCSIMRSEQLLLALILLAELIFPLLTSLLRCCCFWDGVAWFIGGDSYSSSRSHRTPSDLMA
jgi:hypothetical protein